MPIIEKSVRNVFVTLSDIRKVGPRQILVLCPVPNRPPPPQPNPFKSAIWQEYCLSPRNRCVKFMLDASKTQKNMFLKSLQLSPKAHPRLACHETI